MQDTLISGIEAIQAILAPALGISATALLLLSLQNRYSLVISRIRLLNEERRKYLHMLAGNIELGYDENLRHINVMNQIPKMLSRCREVRNAILFLQFSILLFVGASVFIALNLFVTSAVIRYLPLLSFILALLFVLAGVAFSARDVWSSYRVAEIDVKADE